MAVCAYSAGVDMTQDEIIDMARQAGNEAGITPFVFHPVVEIFANLVAAKATAVEREACAKIAEQKRKTEELRSMLTQPEQEPVAIGDIQALKHRIHELEGKVIGYKRILDAEQEPVVCCQQYDTCLWPCTPRGVHLAQRTWVGLTNEEIGDEYVRFEVSKGGFNRFEYAVRAIEAKLKDKNCFG